MINQNNLTIYFLHIRKTAGTSFNKTLNCYSQSPKMLRVDGFRDYWSLANNNNELTNTIIGTHSFYGIHHANLNHNFFKNQYTYITILRDPIERAISYYFYVNRERPQKYEHPQFKLTNRFDLKDFYRLNYMDNDQTRILSGYQSRFFKKCNKFLLETAKYNLENNFSVVGITEKFNETIELVNQTFNWDLDINIPNAKVNNTRPKQKELSKETINSLLECHKLDIELYDFANQLFEKQRQKNNLE